MGDEYITALLGALSCPGLGVYRLAGIKWNTKWGGIEKDGRESGARVYLCSLLFALSLAGFFVLDRWEGECC